MIDGGGDVDDDTEDDQNHACDDGVRGGGLGELVLGEAELAEEEAEAADGKTDTHEAEAGADPGEEGAFGGEVDAGVLLWGLVHRTHGGFRCGISGDDRVCLLNGKNVRRYVERHGGEKPLSKTRQTDVAGYAEYGDEVRYGAHEQAARTPAETSPSCRPSWA